MPDPKEMPAYQELCNRHGTRVALRVDTDSGEQLMELMILDPPGVLSQRALGDINDVEPAARELMPH